MGLRYKGALVSDLKKLTEAADLLGISKRTMYRYIEKGYFPNAVKSDPRAENSHYLIPMSDIEDFKELRKKGGTIED